MFVLCASFLFTFLHQILEHFQKLVSMPCVGGVGNEIWVAYLNRCIGGGGEGMAEISGGGEGGCHR